MRPLSRRLALLTVMAMGAVGLAACGGNPSATETTVGSSGNPLVTPVETQLQSDVQSQLDLVDGDLTQVASDLDNPQADS